MVPSEIKLTVKVYVSCSCTFKDNFLKLLLKSGQWLYTVYFTNRHTRLTLTVTSKVLSIELVLVLVLKIKMESTDTEPAYILLYLSCPANLL